MAVCAKGGRLRLGAATPGATRRPKSQQGHNRKRVIPAMLGHAPACSSDRVRASGLPAPRSSLAVSVGAGQATLCAVSSVRTRQQLRRMGDRTTPEGSVGKEGLESVRKVYEGLQSRRSMRRTEASRRNASALSVRFSKSLASRRQRLSHARVRSTTQRIGNTSNPLA